MKILVYEYASGGGFAEKPIPLGILSEGFGMLRTLAADLCSAGHMVTTLLDSRVLAFQPPLQAELRTAVSSFGKTRSIIKGEARSADAAWVIAPESNGTLEYIIKDLEKEALPLLNCQSRAIAAVSNKASLLETVRKLGIQTPNSLVLNTGGDEKETSGAIAEVIGFPAILKPENGTGMAGLSLVRSKAGVKAAVKKLSQESTSDRFLAQEYISGTPASVSLISTGQKAVPLSLNKQKIKMFSDHSTSIYEGGEVPLESELRTEALDAAKIVVESFKGLKGYLGVDLVLTEECPVVVEVNPRLTTSYIGLRKVVQSNFAQMMIDAVVHRKAPSTEPTKGYANFSKMLVPKPSPDSLCKTYKMEEVVSPPFPFSNEPKTVALVSSYGLTPREAAKELEEAERKLCSISWRRGS